jgi:hypothetical protein
MPVRALVAAFWLGVLVMGSVFLVSAAKTTYTAEVTVGDTNSLAFGQHVDQGFLERLLQPAALSLGSAQLTKRTWGLVTTYADQVSVATNLLANQAGGPVNLRVTLEIPGTVTETNAAGRDGTALVWTALPAGTPLYGTSRVVNWPAVVLLGLAAAVSIWLIGVRDHPRGHPRPLQGTRAAAPGTPHGRRERIV